MSNGYDLEALRKSTFGNSSGLGDYLTSNTINPVTPESFGITSSLATPLKPSDNDWYSNSNMSVEDDGNLFGVDNSTISGVADLGNLGLGIANYLDQRKTGKLNREALKLNINKFKEDQANMKTNRSNFGKISSGI